jgi:hypothetical protein
MAGKRKLVASISSWFCIPEQGMKDMEILSRGSCFFVPRGPASGSGQDKAFSKKFHVLTASHIVAPWRWPKFYQDEWLQHLNETHTHYTMELRYPDGTFITQTELVPSSYHHPTRDLAVLHLDDETEAEDMFKSLDFTALDLVDKAPEVGAELMFRGHNVAGTTTEEADNRKPIPQDVPGTLQLRSPNQTFALTDSVLTDGMCGGPVTQSVTSVLGTYTEKAVGILEGIVPADSPAQDYRNMAVFLEAQDIRSFLSDVEQDKVDAFLKGGQAALHVGQDQDPAKMDWHKIVTEFSDHK